MVNRVISPRCNDETAFGVLHAAHRQGLEIGQQFAVAGFDGVQDAKHLAAEAGQPVDPEDLENLKNYHAIVRTLINGEVYPAFTIRTGASHGPKNRQFADQIIESNQSDCGRADPFVGSCPAEWCSLP